jgi:hypothetical protein
LEWKKYVQHESLDPKSYFVLFLTSALDSVDYGDGKDDAASVSSSEGGSMDNDDSNYSGSESDKPSESSLEDSMVGSSGSESLLLDETLPLPSSPGALRRLQ